MTIPEIQPRIVRTKVTVSIGFQYRLFFNPQVKIRKQLQRLRTLEQILKWDSPKALLRAASITSSTARWDYSWITDIGNEYWIEYCKQRISNGLLVPSSTVLCCSAEQGSKQFDCCRNRLLAIAIFRDCWTDCQLGGDCNCNCIHVNCLKLVWGLLQVRWGINL